jgi:hypothetical protein
MRTGSLLILIAVVFSIFLPVHVVTAAASDNNKTMIITLDVCSKGDHYISFSNDIPTVCESIVEPVKLEAAGLMTVSQSIFSSPLFPSLDERPPKA